MQHSCVLLPVLLQMTQQRHNLFSVFLVIPTGFLRALASKQVQLDEDEDSDTDSEAGDVNNVPDQQQEAGGAKVRHLPGWHAGGVCVGGPRLMYSTSQGCYSGHSVNIVPSLIHSWNACCNAQAARLPEFAATLPPQQHSL
jgi:hypothetical protein